MKDAGMRGQSEILSALLGIAIVAVSLILLLNLYGRVESTANKLTTDVFKDFRGVGASTTASISYVWSNNGLTVFVAVSHVPGSTYTPVDVNITCVAGGTSMAAPGDVIYDENGLAIYYVHFNGLERSGFRGCTATVYEKDTGVVYSVSFGGRS